VGFTFQVAIMSMLVGIVVMAASNIWVQWTQGQCIRLALRRSRISVSSN
jgi:hypothetical protein